MACQQYRSHFLYKGNTHSLQQRCKHQQSRHFGYKCRICDVCFGRKTALRYLHRLNKLCVVIVRHGSSGEEGQQNYPLEACTYISVSLSCDIGVLISYIIFYSGTGARTCLCKSPSVEIIPRLWAKAGQRRAKCRLSSLHQTLKDIKFANQ